MNSVNIVERIYENSEKILSEKKKELYEVQMSMGALNSKYDGFKELRKKELELKESIETSDMKTNMYYYISQILKKSEQENWTQEQSKEYIDKMFNSNN